MNSQALKSSHRNLHTKGKDADKIEIKKSLQLTTLILISKAEVE